MLEGLKPFYTRTLRPVTRLFLGLGLHPNHITIFGLVLFIIAGWLCAHSFWHYALLAVIAGSLMDGLDGILARESNKISRFGAILDSTSDRITEFVLIGGIAMCYIKNENYSVYGPMICFIALSVSFLVSYIKARCEGEGIKCSRGLLQRPERLILLCAGLLAGPQSMFWILCGISIIGGVTVIQRLLQAAAGEKL